MPHRPPNACRCAIPCGECSPLSIALPLAVDVTSDPAPPSSMANGPDQNNSSVMSVTPATNPPAVAQRSVQFSASPTSPVNQTKTLVAGVSICSPAKNAAAAASSSKTVCGPDRKNGLLARQWNQASRHIAYVRLIASEPVNNLRPCAVDRIPILIQLVKPMEIRSKLKRTNYREQAGHASFKCAKPTAPRDISKVARSPGWIS